MHGATDCINCHRVIDVPGQDFCPACGQPTSAQRIDWKFLMHELEHSVLNMDRGILYTLKQLMLHPGDLIRDYLDGRRANQVKPLFLLMATAAVVVSLTHYVTGAGVADSMMVVGNTGATGGKGDMPFDVAKMLGNFNLVKEWMDGHFALVTLLLLPFEAFALKSAFRRFRQLNYPEWLVITAFLTAQTFVIWILLVPLQHWFPHVMVWMALPTVAYSVFSLMQFFRGYPRWKSALRVLLGLGIFALISWLLMLAMTAVVLILSLRG